MSAILDYVRGHPRCSSKAIHEGLDTGISYATLKRRLAELLNAGSLSTSGQGRGRTFHIGPESMLLFPIDVEQYFKAEIDDREIKTRYDLSLIQDVLWDVELFTAVEVSTLCELHRTFTKKLTSLSKLELAKEMERLAIDLSWKSAQIEGNTYTLLETERLWKDKLTATGRTRDEASMLLNHKDALELLFREPEYLHPLSVAGIEDLHGLLVKDLEVGRNIRRRSVGISGTNYIPLDNEHQIREQLQLMCELVNVRSSAYERALLALVLISYIQPFEDGNKRTARIVCNAMLLGSKHCPISFRTTDPLVYKKGMLLFYEQNNISAMKRIFIEQVEFAIGTYF